MSDEEEGFYLQLATRTRATVVVGGEFCRPPLRGLNELTSVPVRVRLGELLRVGENGIERVGDEVERLRARVAELEARLVLAQQVIEAADPLLGRWDEHVVEEYDDVRAKWDRGET